MSRIIFSIIGWTGLSLLLFSCSKDIGNYDYLETLPLDGYTITGIDSVVYGEFTEGSVVRVTPTIQDEHGNEVEDGLFTYQWAIFGEGNKRGEKGLKILGNTKTLDTTYSANVSSLAYFRATEKATGISIEKEFRLESSDVFNSGYFFLSETGSGSSRLQLISHYLGGDTLVADISKLVHTLPLDGAPVQLTNVHQFLSWTTVSTGEMVPMVITSTNAVMLSDRHYAYNPVNTLNNFGDPTFTNFSDLRFYPFSQWTGIFTYGNNLHPISMVDYSNPFFINNAVNNVNGTGFRASRYAAVSHTGNVFGGALNVAVYDEDNHRFLRITNLTASTACVEFPANAATLFPYRNSDQSLVYLGPTTYDSYTACAVLKDNTTGAYHYARFRYDGTQRAYREILDPSIARATQFALEPSYGYLYYATSDNKLYQMNTNTGSVRLMKDYGDKKISLIKNQTFVDPTSDFTDNLQRCLYVCTYSESHVDESGELYVYNIMPSGQDFTTLAHYTGLSKVIDMYHTE